MKETRLFSYKMTHDTGFAPNPFGGFLTLATCKPKIRECKKVGDWIAGFTSGQLNGEKVGDEKLIYLMKVTDKISFKDYWNDPKHEKRKPNIDSQVVIEKRGDNIYMPLVETPRTFSDFRQIPNHNHTEKNKGKDLSGKYVLVSNVFYYFGSKPIIIPNDIRPKVPKGQSSHGSRTYDTKVINDFLSYMGSKYQKGRQGQPHSWFNK
ncbi:MAG: hypothetical protein KJ620_10250 [Candidatus Edwardsbacteria bacterium]|nr:hypothetical protein [Candidatus Edwardsbacteria bacterium]MBU1577444.1 hypothetical protein [Candidatus Edwardsbacteria bacterium]MBU2463222.1 hypothetical protein [Candidatus Edwardsbacteria bacterium]MBU2593011.1 hypothetical protein [Candidatus Edwardsbacteria bacterium]